MVKIFICDDDEGILDVTRIILEEKGYTVVAISDCTTLIKRAEKEQPNIILLDLWMPHKSGDEITRELKQNKLTQHIPVIILSANKDTKTIAPDAGADGFLCKPFDIDELESTVAKYIKS